MSLSETVVAGGGAGLPPWCLPGEQRDGSLNVADVVERHLFGPAGQPGRVAEQVPYQHAGLARSGKLRPILGDGRVEVELTPVGQNQSAERRHGFGGGEAVDETVAWPGTRVCLVEVAAPKIDG